MRKMKQWIGIVLCCCLVPAMTPTAYAETLLAVVSDSPNDEESGDILQTEELEADTASADTLYLEENEQVVQDDPDDWLIEANDTYEDPEDGGDEAAEMTVTIVTLDDPVMIWPEPHVTDTEVLVEWEPMDGAIYYWLELLAEDGETPIQETVDVFDTYYVLEEALLVGRTNFIVAVCAVYWDADAQYEISEWTFTPFAYVPDAPDALQQTLVMGILLETDSETIEVVDDTAMPEETVYASMAKSILMDTAVASTSIVSEAGGTDDTQDENEEGITIDETLAIPTFTISAESIHAGGSVTLTVDGTVATQVMLVLNDAETGAVYTPDAVDKTLSVPFSTAGSYTLRLRGSVNGTTWSELSDAQTLTVYPATFTDTLTVTVASPSYTGSSVSAGWNALWYADHYGYTVTNNAGSKVASGETDDVSVAITQSKFSTIGRYTVTVSAYIEDRDDAVATGAATFLLLDSGYTSWTGYVQSSATMYTLASSSSSMDSKLSTDTTVTVLGESGKYYFVQYGSDYIFVSQSRIDTSLASSSDSSSSDDDDDDDDSSSSSSSSKKSSSSSSKSSSSSSKSSTSGSSSSSSDASKSSSSSSKSGSSRDGDDGTQYGTAGLRSALEGVTGYVIDYDPAQLMQVDGVSSDDIDLILAMLPDSLYASDYDAARALSNLDIAALIAVVYAGTDADKAAAQTAFETAASQVREAMQEQEENEIDSELASVLTAYLDACIDYLENGASSSSSSGGGRGGKSRSETQGDASSASGAGGDAGIDWQRMLSAAAEAAAPQKVTSEDRTTSEMETDYTDLLTLGEEASDLCTALYAQVKQAQQSVQRQLGVLEESAGESQLTAMLDAYLAYVVSLERASLYPVVDNETGASPMEPYVQAELERVAGVLSAYREALAAPEEEQPAPASDV